ncbi:MAG: HEAT repeat domain-containing protein [Planctomycetota bacterium]
MVRIAFVVFALAGSALAHGGVFRPPPRGNPYDPTPTPGRSGRPGTTTQAATSQAAPTPWETWWAYNRERYLRTRERIARRTVISGTRDPDRQPLDGTVLLQTRLIPLMLEALQDQEEEIRTAAAVALGKFGGAVAVEPLQRTYHKDKVRQVRESALVGLLLLRDPSLRDWFRGIVTGHTATRRDRGMAVMALGYLGDSQFLESVLEGKVHVPGKPGTREVHACAALALGFAGSPLSGGVLAGVTREHDPKEARGYAPVSLARLDYVPALPLLQRLLRDRKAMAAARYGAAIAAATLVARSNEEAVALIGQKAQKDHDRALRGLLAISLGRIGGREAVRYLAAGLKYAQQSERGYFYLAIGLSGSDEAGDLLMAELRKIRNDRDRAACALGLGLAGYRKAAPVLRELIEKETDLYFTPHAMVALGLLDDRDAIPLVQKILARKRDPALRQEGAVALALLRRSAAVPELVQLMRDATSTYTRGAVVQALGLVGNETAVDPLIEMYRDPKRKGMERALALAALGRIGDPEPVPLLARLAFNLNYYVVSEAVGELVTIL